MRKFVVSMLLLLSALLIVACGTSGKTSSSPLSQPASDEKAAVSSETKPEAKDEYVFGYIAYDISDIWNEYSSKAFEYAASKADKKVKTVILDSKNSLEESIKAMEALIQQGVDGISIFPISTEQGSQLIKMANDAGIPITVENFAMSIENPGDYIAAVAAEYDQIGYAAIKYVAEQKPGAKVFYCAGQQGAGVYEKYQEGVDRALAEFNGKVEIVSTLHGDWLTDKAYNVATDLISSGKEFDYVFANNGMMAQGVYSALKDADKTDIPIVSTGGSPDDYKMLTEKIESANMTAPVSIQGIQTFKNLYDFVVNGTKPETKFMSLPIIPVSADKLDEFIAWDNYDAAYNFVYKK